MYSNSLPIDKYGQSVTVLELFSFLQKRFCPPVRAGYDDKCGSRSHSFVERQIPIIRKIPLCLNALGVECLTHDLNRVADLPTCARLHSASTMDLIVTATRRSTLGREPCLRTCSCLEVGTRCLLTSELLVYFAFPASAED